MRILNPEQKLSIKGMKREKEIERERKKEEIYINSRYMPEQNISL